MHLIDYAVLGVILVIAGCAVAYLLRQKKRGKRCCGDCEGCGENERCGCKGTPTRRC